MFSVLFFSCQIPEIYLEITSPTNKSAFVEGTEIHFIADVQSTTKGEDVDLFWTSSLIVWALANRRGITVREQ